MSLGIVFLIFEIYTPWGDFFKVKDITFRRNGHLVG